MRPGPARRRLPRAETKIHEEVRRGSLAEVAAAAAAGAIVARGEVVIVVGNNTAMSARRVAGGCGGR